MDPTDVPATGEPAATPVPLRKPATAGEGSGADHSVPPAVDVGAYEQGTDVSRWALARYLVGRAIGESVGRSLLLVAVLAIALAVVSTWVLHSTLLAVLFVLFGLGVLLVRWVLVAVLRRLTAVDRYGPLEQRMRGLISDTSSDVRRELRRVGLPGRTLTLPLLAVRLAGRRRKETLARLRDFRVDNAVPQARLDELHMILRSAANGGVTPPSGGRWRPDRMAG